LDVHEKPAISTLVQHNFVFITKARNVKQRCANSPFNDLYHDTIN
jgi:hypothetical protein